MTTSNIGKNNMARLHLSLAICKAGAGSRARHWILILAEEGAKNGTWYHSVGGPTQGTAYKVEIQVKKVQSQGIEAHHFIGEVSASDTNKVKVSAQKVSAKFCQTWVLNVPADLERKT